MPSTSPSRVGSGFPTIVIALALMALIVLACGLIASAAEPPLTFDLAAKVEGPPEKPGISKNAGLLTHNLVFDAGFQHDAQPLIFDLAAVAEPDDEHIAKPDPDDSPATCHCGCGRAGCKCSKLAACAASKPIVRMTSASWCRVCKQAIDALEADQDLPFELQVIDDEAAQSAPSFTWQGEDGKWYTPIDPRTGKPRPGWFGVADLVAHWQSTRRMAAPGRPSSEDSRPRAANLHTDLAARVHELGTQALRPPSAQLGAGLSKKKPTEPSPTGSTPNAAASAAKSPFKSGASTPPSTRSRSG